MKHEEGNKYSVLLFLLKTKVWRIWKVYTVFKFQCSGSVAENCETDCWTKNYMNCMDYIYSFYKRIEQIKIDKSIFNTDHCEIRKMEFETSF